MYYKLDIKEVMTWGCQYYNLLHDDSLRKKAEFLTYPTFFLRKKFKKNSTLPIYMIK
jgi:hypothetical protein